MTRSAGTLLNSSVVRTILTGGTFTVVVILLMMWLAGAFHRKIGETERSAEVSRPRALGARAVAVVRSIRVPAIETSVGTVRAQHEAAIASKILARVEIVNVRAGQKVGVGEILVRLDDEDLKAREKQAAAALDAATVRRNQARIEFDRVEELFKRETASKIEFDRADSALKSAEAELERARQAHVEAQTTLSYATITSPFDGVVIDKQVEPGDTVVPGQALLTLYDPTRMELVARVRESLATRLSVGQNIDVKLAILDSACTGRISEIVPEAETASRTFSVKVTGPCPPGVYSGMFGRLLIPLDDEDVLVIPQAAVRHVGQLDLVEVVLNDTLHRRAVQLGRRYGADVEVLSGLRAAERVALPETLKTDEGGQ